MYSNKYYDLCLVLLTMNEWAACIDAITFIFQARTTPINNEKKKRVKTKREKARHIHIHTYCSHNSASKFIDVYVWLMNRTCEDYSNYRKQIYISSDRFTTLYKAFCCNRIIHPMRFNIAQLVHM
jgi:hypothetical protein